MVPYYDRDGIVIYHGDCRDVLPSIDPASVDLLLTDPPYGINLDTDYSGWDGVRKSATVHMSIEGDGESFNPTQLLLYRRRILWGANNFPQLLEPGGWFIWKKTNHHPRSSQCEMAWTNVTRKISVVYESAKPGTARASWHPAEKPLGLMALLVEKWTNPGDLVLDPYMGSGPVAQACHELGRRYIGIELVEDYCKVAVGRLAQQTLDLDGGAA